MIEKRINYRFGGGYQGSSAGSVDRGSGNTGGGGGRQEYSAQQYTAPTPAPISRETNLDKREQAAITSLENAMKIADLDKKENKKEQAPITILENEMKIGRDPSVQMGSGVTPMYRSRYEIENILSEQRKKAREEITPSTKMSNKILSGLASAVVPFGGFLFNKAIDERAMGFNRPKNAVANLKRYTNTASRDNRREEGIMQAQAPQNIIKENIQKFSPEQLNLLRKRYAELNSVIESGEYNGQKLNNNQLSKLIDTSKQMKDFLVSEIGGMKIA